MSGPVRIQEQNRDETSLNEPFVSTHVSTMVSTFVSSRQDYLRKILNCTHSVHRGGCTPLPSCFIRFLGPPSAPPLPGGGGIASTLLLDPFTYPLSAIKIDLRNSYKDQPMNVSSGAM